MWLEKIDIQHFRNYSEASVSFSPHLNIFLGRNAQGKTNILEAIYFAGTELVPCLNGSDDYVLRLENR